MIAKFAEYQPFPSFNDGVSSISSTFAVDDDVKSPPQLQQIQRSVRGLSFNLEDNQAFDNTQWCMEDTSASWYSSADYSHFRQQTKTSLKEGILNLSESDEIVLTRAYQACCKAANYTENVLTPQDTMYLLTNDGDSNTLGMEKKTLQIIRKDRLRRRRALYFIVREAQRYICDCKEIRYESEYVSLCSRLFSRTTAMALAGEIARTN
jgi:hypothetical protein